MTLLESRLSSPSLILVLLTSSLSGGCGSESTEAQSGEQQLVPAGEPRQVSTPVSGQSFTSAGQEPAMPGLIAADDPVPIHTSAVPGEAATEDVCRQVAFGSEANPVNVHILLDRSQSMLEPVRPEDPAGPTRWTAMTSALRAFLQNPLTAGAKVGLQFFGLNDGADDCSVEKYMIPAVEIGPMSDSLQALLGAIDATSPGSLTPTGPAVDGALAYARSSALLPENAGRPTVVVLASDGLPSECFPVNDEGQPVHSFSEMTATLERYAFPAKDASGVPLEPAIRTYIAFPPNVGCGMAEATCRHRS